VADRERVSGARRRAAAAPSISRAAAASSERARANAPRRELGDEWWRVLLRAKHAAAPRQRHQPHGLAPAHGGEEGSGAVNGHCAHASARGRGGDFCARQAARCSHAGPHTLSQRPANGECAGDAASGETHATSDRAGSASVSSNCAGERRRGRRVEAAARARARGATRARGTPACAQGGGVGRRAHSRLRSSPTSPPPRARRTRAPKRAAHAPRA